MLRWLRKYNVYILVAVCALLAVAFLIQGTVSIFVPGPKDQPIGTIGERELTVGDRNNAARELTLLSEIPVRGRPGMFAAFAPREPLQWLLLNEAADQMGIRSSRAEVRQLLQIAGLAEGDKLAAFASKQGVARDTVRRTLRAWARVQAYKELVLGLAHLRPGERIRKLQQAAMLMRFGALSRDAAKRATQGRPRISRPLLERFLHDQHARARVALARIPAKKKLDAVGKPDEKRVRSLFKRYRDDLPGEGEPYGFGYRFPDRIKLSYLAIEMEKLRAAVEVDYADALAYYEDHPDEFRKKPADDGEAKTQPATAATGEGSEEPPPVKPFKAVRAKVFKKLRGKKARRLGARMVKAARASLLEEARGLEREGGYRRIPEGWEPKALSKVAAELEKRFGVKPRVAQPEGLLTREELGSLPEIGEASLPDRLAGGAGIVPYVFSARAFDPKSSNPVTALRLQEKLPSHPLRDEAGSRYLVRIREAAPARTPKKLEEVADRVRRDAKRLAAYEALKQESDRWLARARQNGIEAIAKRAGTAPVEPPPFPRRRASRGGALAVPEIPSVGKSAAFVDAVFKRVREATKGGEIVAPEPKRYAVVAVDRKLSLVAFRLKAYKPLTRKRFERLASSPYLPVWIEQTLGVATDSDPFSVEALSARVGFERAEKGG